MENGSLQYENQILKSELEAEHFILTQMAELGKVRNVRECQVAINNLLEKIGHFTKADRAYIVDEKDGCYYNTYEWCNEGIEPQINQLQNLRAEDMPYWIPKLSSGESIFIEEEYYHTKKNITTEKGETLKNILSIEKNIVPLHRF